MDKYIPIIEALNRKQLVVILGLPKEHHPENDCSLTQKDIINKLCCELGVSNVAYEDAVDMFIRRKGKQELIARLASYLMANSAIPSYFECLDKLHPKCVIETHPFSQWYSYVINRPDSCIHCSQKNFSEDFDVINTEQVFLSYFGSYASDNPLLASNEIDDRLTDKNNLSVTFQSLLRNQIVFIGFDPNDRFFKRIYDHFCRRNGEYPNTAYLLTDDILPSDSNAYGENENLIIWHDIKTTLNNILAENEARKISVRSKNSERVTRKKGSPYKYLNSFEEEDADIFFGRDDELVTLCIRVEATSQILVISSKSGYGKTSMINAGLIPRLREREEYDIFYIRCGNNPWKELNRSVFKRDVNDTGSIIATDFSKKKYQFIIIDQFEELFTGGSDTEISIFRDGITNFLHDNPNTKIILSIREDFYHMIGKSNIIQYLDKNDYFLPPLPNRSAVDAIIKPAAHFGISFEDGLPEEIVDDLSSRENNADSNNGIDPSQLQIVCDKLYQESEINNDKIITRDLYVKLGKAEEILARYIEDSLGVFKSNAQELSSAKEILKSMVSSKNTRKPVTKDALKECIRDVSNIDHIINSLIETRLIRRITDDTNSESYELTHEYIIKKINEWMDMETLNLNKLREMLDNDLLRWQKYSVLKNFIYDEEMITELNNYKNRINHSADIDAYILASLVNSNMLAKISTEDAKYWIQQCNNSNAIDKYFECIIENRKGYARNCALFIWLVLTNQNSVPIRYEKIVNPHINAVLTFLVSLDGIMVNAALIKNINATLDSNRTRNMVIVEESAPCLGLSVKRVKEITKKNNIATQLLKFFPDKERNVTLKRYRIDKYLVTNAEYAEFEENHTFDIEKADFPVVGISFIKALKYAEWWNKTIPTEDQWEYAARGNNGYDFPWGNDWNPEEERTLSEDKKKCNTSLTGTDGLGRVDEYQAGVSPFNCYNMAGMVWEWTSTQAGSDLDKKIVKGGSWSLMDIMPWLWYRFSYDGRKDYYNVGFRCVINE
ncbi:MAG: SUMF1/EgtB/PvdO family nonheme iron enzyme [Clostridia bacterium]|uniref:nSTAND1 domain-containing NTPase n=1 Tax=Anaerocaecibacter muris TaxID=2941513 RepID=UPI0020407E64|nr:SUMF1/EgtB/PvdO family nonheme iron enzyme [Anaerocaecibacter muris]MCX4384222.1 SUMF1/EgtB/PvdO family nonheme iron enzyme [Clostridia bacterium]